MQNRRVRASSNERQHTRKNSPDDCSNGFDLRRVRAMPSGFFMRDPRAVAHALLGKVLVRRQGRDRMAGRIVEVEAYLGTADAAAHAASGLTPRNRVIFGPPGRSYVYFIYGNYYCLNVSCMPEGEAGCILIRALEPLAGLAAMARNRGMGDSPAPNKRLLTTGPGRLCEALHISRAHDNDLDMTRSDSGLWIGDDGFRPGLILVTPRIGITKSAEQPLRYILAKSEYVSGPRVK